MFVTPPWRLSGHVNDFIANAKALEEFETHVGPGEGALVAISLESLSN